MEEYNYLWNDNVDVVNKIASRFPFGGDRINY